MVAISQEKHPLRMTEAEYLEYERACESKNEFYKGEVFAMAGATYEHNMIFMATSASLFAQLRGKPCRVNPSDQRIRIPTGLYTYADISVVCGEPQFAENAFDTLINPLVIIEILSKSSEGYDRGKKFQHYREIATLQNYMLISQDQPRIESYTKEKNGKWVLTDAVGLAAILEIPSISCTLALADVYENVLFTANDVEQGAASEKP
jgi:Uma2 family endonuclease